MIIEYLILSGESGEHKTNFRYKTVKVLNMPDNLSHPSGKNYIKKAQIKALYKICRLVHIYRAGRCRAGKCYHLFSKIRFSTLEEFPTPEILKYPLQVEYFICLFTIDLI